MTVGQLPAPRQGGVFLDSLLSALVQVVAIDSPQKVTCGQRRETTMTFLGQLVTLLTLILTFGIAPLGWAQLAGEDRARALGDVAQATVFGDSDLHLRESAGDRRRH